MGRRIAHLECVGIHLLPVLDRDSARIEELEVGAKGASRVRDGPVTCRARSDASAKHRNVGEPVAPLTLNVDRGCLSHARTHTFWPQSARIVRSAPTTLTRIGSAGGRSSSASPTPGLHPRA